ncbi:hypothetical protein [Gordonia mangrovi]|nr:hypothetical protein [Gordonia mangrovi]UVF76317.1 hypothetical protein NWF22_13035 [Gordonia mangrovi]
MTMSRGIIAVLVGVVSAFSVAACTPGSTEPASVSGSTAALPSGIQYTANGDEIVWCAVSPVYQHMYWAVVVGDPTGGPCVAGEVITQEEFEAAHATWVCQVALPGGGTADYYANSQARARNLAQGACLAG